jgi:hypothetical protein
MVRPEVPDLSEVLVLRAALCITGAELDGVPIAV